MPERIQLRRTAGWRKPEDAIVVARPTIYGNPFRVGDSVTATFSNGDSREITMWPELAVILFRAYLDQDPGWRDQQARELRGHDLACWCRLDQPCHADVLLEIANA